MNGTREDGGWLGVSKGIDVSKAKQTPPTLGRGRNAENGRGVKEVNRWEKLTRPCPGSWRSPSWPSRGALKHKQDGGTINPNAEVNLWRFVAKIRRRAVSALDNISDLLLIHLLRAEWPPQEAVMSLRVSHWAITLPFYCRLAAKTLTVVLCSRPPHGDNTDLSLFFYLLWWEINHSLYFIISNMLT